MTTGAGGEEWLFVFRAKSTSDEARKLTGGEDKGV